MRMARAGSRATRCGCFSPPFYGGGLEEMHTLIVIAVVLALGALITAIGSWLIGRAHPPRGRFIKVRRIRQHVVELGSAGGGAPPMLLFPGGRCDPQALR